MIRAIRMRHVEKPFITQQIIYNHREEPADTNSDMSFLKLSQNTSKQLNTSPDVDHFSALEARICKMEQNSALKLNRAKLSLNFLQAVDLNTAVQKKGGANTLREIMEENKQNFQMTYRRMPVQAEESENMQQCTFQMDEHLNYVKNTFYNSRNFAKAVNQELKPYAKQFRSLQNSRQTQIKQQSQTFNKTKKINYAVKHLARSVSVRSDRDILVGRQTSRKKDNRRINEEQNPSSKRSLSIESNSKKGKIYKQILSLYSIPKLLAMDPRSN